MSKSKKEVEVVEELVEAIETVESTVILNLPKEESSCPGSGTRNFSKGKINS